MKSFKLLPVLITLFISSVIGAQTSNVNTARIRLNNQDVKDAKKYIDLAAENEETKNSSKMWLTRGDVYYAIATAPDSTKEGLVILLLDRDAAFKSLTSYVNCLKNNEEKFIKDAVKGGVGVSVVLYNQGIAAYEQKDFSTALRDLDLILSFYPFDKKNELTKAGLSENMITKASGQIAYEKKDLGLVNKYLGKLAEKSFLDPDIYILLSKAYQEQGDTATAIKYVGQGRELIPENENLINEELFLYSKTNQGDKLVAKLTKVIEGDPTNAKYYYYRAATYEGLFKQDTTKLDYLEKAEMDYKKTIELDPNDFDANFALGIFYYNQAVPVINQREMTDNVKQKKKFDELNAKATDLLKKSIKYYEAAIAINDKDIDLLDYTKRCYAQLGDEAKVIELGKKIKALKGN